jgi:hypothetical protein
MICGGSLIQHVKTLLPFRKQRAVRPLRLQLHLPLRLLRSHRILPVVAKSRIFLPQLIGSWWLTSHRNATVVPATVKHPIGILAGLFNGTALVALHISRIRCEFGDTVAPMLTRQILSPPCRRSTIPKTKNALSISTSEIGIETTDLVPTERTDRSQMLIESLIPKFGGVVEVFSARSTDDRGLPDRDRCRPEGARRRASRWIHRD